MIGSSLDIQVGGNHYKDFAIQPVEYIHANNLPFIEGCIIKYVTRWKNKNGIADLEKAKHFVDMLIELEKEKETHCKSTTTKNGLLQQPCIPEQVSMDLMKPYISRWVSPQNPVNLLAK